MKIDIKKMNTVVTEYLKTNSSIKAAAVLGIDESSVRRWMQKYRKLQDITPNGASAPPNIAAQSVAIPQRNIELLNGSIVVFSDAHVLPNQEPSVAAVALLKVLKLVNPQIVINGGDIFDFASISKHDKLGWYSNFTVAEEIQAGVNLLNQVFNESKGAIHISLEGNHDVRFNKFLSKHIPQFKGVKGFEFVDHLPREWQYAMSVMINKNTLFIHAHHCGVHAAYNNTMKGGISVITGHTHILEVKPFTDYSGTRFGVQTGTLASIAGNPLFGYTLGTPLNWQAGFVVLTFINGILQYPEICSVNSNNQAFFRGQII